MTLYELTGEMLQLQQMIDEGYDPEVIADTMEGIDYEIERKADGYAKIMRNLQTEADGLAKEIDRLAERKLYLDNQIKRLKTNLQESMEKIGKTKFKTELFNFSICNNPPSVIIPDPKAVPDEFKIPQPPKLDGRKIREYLKDNIPDWGRLEQGKTLRIK